MDLDSLTLLTKPVSPKATIEENFIDVTVRKGVFPSGAFSIGLPNGWRMDQDEPGSVPGPNDPIVPIARFSPHLPDALGALEKPQIVVWAVWLPREIHGADWLHTWITSQGFTAIQARELPAKHGLMGDALVHREADNKRMLHRLFTVKDGDLLFVIDGRVEVSPASAAELEAMQEIMLMAMLRFRLLEPSGQNFAEPFEALTLAGSHGQVAMMIPSAWHSETAADHPIDGAGQVISNVQAETTIGTILITLGGRGDSAEEMEATTRAKLGGQGYEIASTGTVLIDRTVETTTAQVLRFEASSDGQAIVLLCARMTFEQLPVSVVLITPTDSVLFEAWSINRRAFDILFSSLHPINS